MKHKAFTVSIASRLLGLIDVMKIGSINPNRRDACPLDDSRFGRFICSTL